MKNPLKPIKKLALNKTTIRALLADDLKVVAGGDGGYPTNGLGGGYTACSFNVACKLN
jgi:hypothetical protein